MQSTSQTIRCCRRLVAGLVLPVLAGACATSEPGRDFVQQDGEESAPVSDTQEEVEPSEKERYRMLRELFSNAGRLGGMPASETTNVPGMLNTSPELAGGSEGGEFLVAPIPFLNPTIGVGLAIGGAYMLPIGKNSPPSTYGAGVLVSENGTAGAVVGFNGYFDEDRYRVTAGVAEMRVNYDLTLEGEGEIPLRQEFLVVALEFLARVFERVFIGPQVLLSGLDTELRREQDSGTLPEEELNADSISLGLRLQRDTRDSNFYPRSGSLADLQLRFNDESLGSSFTYQTLPIAYNAFFAPGERDVVALRASARFTFGDVPFYGENYFGSQSDLRGYTIGTIHDKTLLAGQVEYRRELFWRLGAVAFAGVGTVVPKLDQLHDANALPAVGFGLRFTLEEENHVNFRLDFAWGEDQSAIYFGVGEAF